MCSSDLRRTAGRREAKEVFDRPDPRGCCAFHTRCAWASERYRAEVPPLRSVAGGHRVACFLIRGSRAGKDVEHLKKYGMIIKGTPIVGG